MEQMIDYDSVVARSLFGFPESPPFLPPFSNPTNLTFTPPPPRDHISSDLYIHEPPQQYADFEETSIIPDYDENAFAEFEVPQQPSITVVSGLSAQTMAARERRKRISEKTMELGRLVPGGNRMSTAQMLQAASKYLKFLQAQYDVLKLMVSIPVPVCKSIEDGHLKVLLGSTVIQEKLSVEGMCIAPKEIVDEFAIDPQLNQNC